MFIRLMFVTFSLLALSSCNTIEGMGEDIEDAGDAIEDAAEDNNHY